LCGGTNSRPLTTGRRFGVEINVVICPACSLVYQNPRMNEAELDEFYEHDYRRLYSGSADTPTQEFLDEQRQRGARILAFSSPLLKSGGQVLDVGCGAGGALLPFRSAGYSVMGLEPGTYGTWGAQNMGLDIRGSRLEALRSDEVAPNLTIFSFVLEHVSNPLQMLSEARRLAAAGDCVFVEVPNLETLRWTVNHYCGSMDQYFHVAHLTYFTPVTLSAMLRRSGWDVVKITTEGHYSVSAVAAASQPIPAESLTKQLQGNVSAIVALVKDQERRDGAERFARGVLRPGARIFKSAAARVVRRERVDAIIRRCQAALHTVLNFR